MGWENKVHNLLGHATRGPFMGASKIYHAPTDFPVQEIPAIWSDVYLEVDPETGMQVMSSVPNIGVRLADLDRPPKKNDAIYKGDKPNRAYYRIRVVEPDGEGGATLVLEKVDCCE